MNQTETTSTTSESNDGSFLSQIDLTALLELAISVGTSLIIAIIILLVGFTLARWLGNLLKKALGHYEHIDPVVSRLLVKILRIVIIGLTIFAIVGQIDSVMASLFAVVGAAGLAVGLALQGTLSNVASGVMILLMRPFSIGHAINVNGTVFIVDEIGLFMTTAHQPDGPTIYLPNSQIWGNQIINLAVCHNDIRRFNETFGISYSDDIDKAIGIINRVLDEEPKVLADPARLVAVTALGDSSVDILVWAWLPRADWWPTRLELIKKVKQAFDAEGITIPFPQRDVHVFNQVPKIES